MYHEKQKVFHCLIEVEAFSETLEPLSKVLARQKNTYYTKNHFSRIKRF